MDKKNIEDVVALTPLQEGMLFHFLKDTENAHYFEQLSLSVSGNIHIPWFNRAWDFVISTNEMLRTRFQWKKVKTPMQVILKENPPDLRFRDFSHDPESERIDRVEDVKIKDRQEKFTLDQPPFRVILCKVDELRYEMIVSNHHILYDGWSGGVILKEFFKAYHDLSKGIIRPETPVKPKFGEFVQWRMRRDKSGEDTFWKTYLGGMNTGVELPLKKAKAEDNREGTTYRVRLPRRPTTQLE
jgi:iturin family lipopeptide synthetase B